MKTLQANTIGRRSFIKIAGITAGAALASSCAVPVLDTKQPAINAQASNTDHMAEMVATAIPTSNANTIKAKPFQVYDAQLPVIDGKPVKQVTWESSDVVQYIAKDVAFQAWTFGGNAPGPILVLNEGDQVQFS